jgi:hypothetical protein
MVIIAQYVKLHMEYNNAFGKIYQVSLLEQRICSELYYIPDSNRRVWLIYRCF